VPRGAIVPSGAPAAAGVDVPVADGSAGDVGDVEGVAGVVAGVVAAAGLFGAVVLSAALAMPIPDKPIADAISACAIRAFSLSSMSTPSKLDRRFAAGTDSTLQGICPR